MRDSADPLPSWAEATPSRPPCRHDHLRRWLRARRITPGIVRKGVESSHRLGRYRWTIERKAEHFLAFAGIAATLVCFRRLSRQR